MYLEPKIRRQKEMLLGIIFGSLLFAQQSQIPFMFILNFLCTYVNITKWYVLMYFTTIIS